MHLHFTCVNQELKYKYEVKSFCPPCWDAGYSNASAYLTALALITLVSLVRFEPAFHFHESFHVQLKVKLQSKNCCHESKGLAIF